MELQFNLFRNDKKGNDKAPDYRGNDKDKTIEVACWLKPMKDGKGQYLSCVVKDKAQPQAGIGTPSYGNAPDVNNPDGDSLPF